MSAKIKVSTACKVKKKSYSLKQVIKKLKHIRDLSLDRWVDIVESGKNSGVGAVSDTYIRVAGELARSEDRLKDLEDSSKGFNGTVNLVFNNSEDVDKAN